MARPWMLSTKISLAVWVLVVLAQTGIIGGTYLLFSRHYVSTANAQVDGDQMDIVAPATGTVVRWDIGAGSVVRPGQAVGRVRLEGAHVEPERIIRAPGEGRIALSRAVEGQYVQAGTQLAIAYPSGIYVTARVLTNDVGEVKLGAPVDIDVDAFPDARVTGLVGSIQSSTAGQLTVYPSADQNLQNPQPIAEYVPVRIFFDQTGGAALVPGMSVTVHIRRDGPLHAAR
jgi:multidrug resistance efflux pump